MVEQALDQAAAQVNEQEEKQKSPKKKGKATKLNLTVSNKDSPSKGGKKKTPGASDLDLGGDFCLNVDQNYLKKKNHDDF